MHDKCNDGNTAQERRQPDSGLDHQPNLTLVHVQFPLVKPRRVDVREQVRQYGDEAENARTFDNVPVEFFCFVQR
jgi:hypothetical protein